MGNMITRIPLRRFRTGKFIAYSLVASLLVWSDSNLVAEDWPSERGNSQGTGAVAASLPDELVEVWRYQAEEAIEATPVSLAGRIFLADVEGTLTCLDLASGKKIWSQKTENGFLASPAVQKKMLVIGDYDGQVHALDAETGKPLWTFATEGEISAGVTFYEDKVLVPSQDGNLYCLQADDGKLVWKYETTDQIQCSPTLAGDRTFLGGCDGQLHSVALKTGTGAADPLPLGGPTLSTPAVLGNQAFVTTHAGLVMAFDWKAHKPLWQFEDPARVQEYRSSPAVTAEAVVVSSQFRSVFALNPQTGELLWKQTLRRFAEASPVIAGKDVWIAGTDGRLYRFALADGKLLKQFEFRGSFIGSPAIAGNHLVLANDDGLVIALGPKPAES